MKINTILYDLDGTLMDTLQDLRDATNAALASQGFPGKTLSEMRHLLGNGMVWQLTHAAPEGTPQETLEKIFAFFREYYGVHCEDHTAPYDGVLEVIDKLSAAGIRQGVLSNKPDFAVKTLCNKFFPTLTAAGVREGMKRKPDPQLLLTMMEELGGTPDSTLYVGDSEVDIETARNAGVPCIAVTWGFRDVPELIAAGAKTMVDTPDELLQAVLAMK